MMIPKLTRLLWILVLIGLIITGCNRQNTTLTSNSFTESFIPLSEGLGVQELVVLENEDLSIAVIGLCYQQDTNSLFAVYDQTGILAHWDMNFNLPEAIHPLGIQSVSTLQFTQNCDKVAGSTQAENRIGLNNVEFEYIDDFRIWNTVNGQEVDCMGDCENVKKNPLDIGAAINTSGKEFLLYSEISYSYLREDMGKSMIIRPPETDSPTIGRIIISPTSARFVIAYLEGGISIGNDPLVGNRWIERNATEEKRAVQALAIAPTEQYIARIRENCLTVWEIGSFRKEELMDVAIEDERMLIFDQTGQYLFVGGSDHIQVWNIDQQQMVKEIATESISAMGISQDNRLLIWGSESGEVHVWGVRSME